MLYALRGGGIIQSTTPEDLVIKLNEQSVFGEMSGVYEYMDSVAKVCKQVNNIDIRIDTEENFIADLIKAGLMIVIDENKISPKKEDFRK